MCCWGYKYQIAFNYWLCFLDLRAASLFVSVGHIIAGIIPLILFYTKVIDINFLPVLTAIAVNLIIYTWLTVVLVKCNTLRAIKACRLSLKYLSLAMCDPLTFMINRCG